MSKEIRFKRLPLKSVFQYLGTKYRKATNLGAYKLKENGVGETNTVVPFHKNTWVKS